MITKIQKSWNFTFAFLYGRLSAFCSSFHTNHPKQLPKISSLPFLTAVAVGRGVGASKVESKALSGANRNFKPRLKT
jgi:hypothetical protein